MSEFIMRENYFQLLSWFFCWYPNLWIDFPAVLLPVVLHTTEVCSVTSVFEILRWYSGMDLYACFQGSLFFFPHVFNCHPYETLGVKESFLVRKAANSNGAEISGKGNLKMQNTYKSSLSSKVKDPSPQHSEIPHSEKWQVPPLRDFVWAEFGRKLEENPYEPVTAFIS